MTSVVDSAIQHSSSPHIAKRAAEERLGHAKILSCSVVGVDAVPVDVTVAATPGEFSYHVVGLSSRSSQQGRKRVLTALKTLKLETPLANISVCLTPLELAKQGCGFDLPIVLGILSAHLRVSLEPLKGVLVLGELMGDGTFRPAKGSLSAALLARSRGCRGVLVPHANANEALAVTGIEVYSAGHLSEVLEALRREPPQFSLGQPQRPVAWRHDIDISDVQFHATARAALEISAAGGHNMLIVGGPGNVKSALARRISTILPKMKDNDFLETMKVYSAVGLVDRGLFVERPFRAPHHSITAAALVGGGVVPKPGEISLAHNGVLFLDLLHEFSREALDALRGPLEQRAFALSRNTGNVVMPASFQLVAATIPCPCGWLDSGTRECVCSAKSIERHWMKMSGLLFDKFDLQVFMKTLERSDGCPTTPSERSEVVRMRVASAQARQQKRLEPWGIGRNAEMRMEAIAATCALDAKCNALLSTLAKAGGRATQRHSTRILRLARTIADLREQAAIDDACLIDASKLCYALSFNRDASFYSWKRC